MGGGGWGYVFHIEHHVFKSAEASGRRCKGCENGTKTIFRTLFLPQMGTPPRKPGSASGRFARTRGS